MADRLLEVASAWARRTSQLKRTSSVTNLLLKSGLFIEADTETLGVQPICGAVGAYLDGLHLALSRDVHLLADLLRYARSSRRLGKGPRRSAKSVTAWLAIILGAKRSNPDALSWLVDTAAQTDLSIAWDASELAGPPLHGTIPYKLREFAYVHGSPWRSLFPQNFDFQDHLSPTNPNRIARADYRGASILLKNTPDADLVALLVTACVFADQKRRLDSGFLKRIVPASICGALAELASVLEIVSLPNGTRMAQRVLALDDLEKIFPQISRGHRESDRIARVPWLTAYVLTHLMGGKLPSVSEMVEAYAMPAIASAAMDGLEAPYGGREAQQRTEWSWEDPATSPSDLRGLLRVAGRATTVNRSGSRSLIVDRGTTLSTTQKWGMYFPIRGI